MDLDTFSRLIAPIRTRLLNLVARAVVQLVDDSNGLQTLQLSVLDGETRSDIERLQQYGFTSVPFKGAEACVLFVGGRRDHGIAVAVDDREHRLKGLEEGEVALYHKDGAKVHFKADGSVEIAPKSGKNIVLAGGTAKVARVGDATAGHTHNFSLTAPSGTLGGPVTGTISNATDTIHAGAGQVLA